MTEDKQGRSCENCLEYEDERTYEDPHGAIYCRKLRNVDFFKNWPFKNGCKHFKLRWREG